jgi:hypothetical protein
MFMLKQRGFWYLMMAACLLVYVAGAVLAWRGELRHPVVLLSAVLLVAHVLEIPMAFKRLSGRNPQPLRVIVATTLFGLLWWVPASRGLLAVR